MKTMRPVNPTTRGIVRKNIDLHDMKKMADRLRKTADQLTELASNDQSLQGDAETILRNAQYLEHMVEKYLQ